jgi:hypothetical protein
MNEARNRPLNANRERVGKRGSAFVGAVSECWDFAQETTHSYTNCFHKYPAMMVPRVAEELVRRHGRPGGVCFDPFCGTGRALVAASLAGMHSVGIDVNPLAVFLTSVKLMPPSPDVLHQLVAKIILTYRMEPDHELFIRDLDAKYLEGCDSVSPRCLGPSPKFVRRTPK